MSTSLYKRAGNRALRVNPPNADIHLGRWGSNWGYTVFCLMTAALLAILIWSTTLARNRRTFHYLLVATLAISALAWYAMASDLGATPVTVEFLRNSRPGPGLRRYPTRQIWFARYIDWTLTTSLLLLSLLLMTGMSLSVIFVTLFFNVLMIVCGLIGALTPSRYKWSFFVFACAALGFVLYHVFSSGLRSARRLEGGFGRTYLAAASVLAITWPLYPICWALSEGGNVIGISEEFLFYGLLDLVSKPLFAFLLLSMLSKCDYGALRLRSGKVTDARIEERGPAHDRAQSGQAKGTEASGLVQPPGATGIPGEGAATSKGPVHHSTLAPPQSSHFVAQRAPADVPQTAMSHAFTVA